MMLRKTEGGEEFTGNDRYEGFYIDLLKAIAGTCFDASLRVCANGAGIYLHYALRR